MGLSILIPVFNYDVRKLVHTLSAQLNETKITGEIILLDDASDPLFDSTNKSLSQIPYVSYSRNVVNAGRTTSRKLLADMAKHNYLLFLDCDSKIIRDDFLKIYNEHMDLNEKLVSGGRVYDATPPEKCSLHLHWKYGTKRESCTPGSKTGSAFMSPNFLVKKSLFLQLDFSILLKGYGHEDSLWGIQFRKMEVQQKQIHNPVLHASLENADVFLKKSEQALENLLELAKVIDTGTLKKEIKIFRWYCRMRAWGIAGLFELITKPFISFFRKNLSSCSPSLSYFDCYRLAALIRLSKKKTSQSLNKD